MLTRKTKVTLVAAAVGLLAAAPAQAQRAQGLLGAGGPNLGRSLEVALEHQEELGLSEDQIAQLSEMKALVDEELTPLAERMKALREGIWAGDVDRAQGAREMQELRGQFLTASAPLRGRVQEILTVEQHNKLWPLVRPLGRGGGRAFQSPGWGRGGGRVPMRGGRGVSGLRRGSQGQCRAPAFGFRNPRPGAWMFLRGWRGRGLPPAGPQDGPGPDPQPGVFPEGGF